jgi:glutathione synthase/RimK-type ligase-like ATP-grasp enzyme
MLDTGKGIFVIEVNDNPNLNHGCEDVGEKDEVWVQLTRWFIETPGAAEQVDAEGRRRG